MLSCVVLFGMLLLCAASFVALSPPWLGARFAASHLGVVIQSLDASGPLAEAGVKAGDVLVSVGEGDQAISLGADDIVEDPDMLGSREASLRFFQRQKALLKALSAPKTTATIATGMETRTIVFKAGSAPLRSLPAMFWLPILSAVFGLVIGAWILAIRHGDRTAWLFALSGFGLCLSAGAASIYGSRELALSPALTGWLSCLNHTGTLLFCAALVGFFMRHPTRLYSRWAAVAYIMAISALILADVIGWLPPEWHYGAVVTLLGSLVPLLVIQMWASHRNPATLSAIKWLGFSVLIGVGVVWAALLAPVAFGRSPIIRQADSFAIIAVIYGAIAIGVRRRGLFDTGQGAFRVLYYAAGVAAFVILDAVLALAIGLEAGPAMGVSSLLVGTLYLPFRDTVWRKLFSFQRLATHEVFSRAMDVAFGVGEKERARRWRELLETTFDPLTLVEAPNHVTAASIRDYGETLAVPAAVGAPGFILRHRNGGGSLFNVNDVKLIDQLTDLLRNAEKGRDEYARGVFEERSRIARDLHDDLGARLVSGAISADSDARALSQEALSDLRAILTDLSSGSTALDEGLADLRHETARRAQEAGLALDWPMIDEALADARIEGRRLKALRSAVREATTNAIRHSKASTLTVRIEVDEREARLTVSDDGRGVGRLDIAVGEAQKRGGGRGVDNMRRRMIAADGRVAALATEAGAALRFDTPISWAAKRRRPDGLSPGARSRA
jgi:signal transduction histidine kinase